MLTLLKLGMKFELHTSIRIYLNFWIIKPLIPKSQSAIQWGEQKAFDKAAAKLRCRENIPNYPASASANLNIKTIARAKSITHFYDLNILNTLHAAIQDWKTSWHVNGVHIKKLCGHHNWEFKKVPSFSSPWHPPPPRSSFDDHKMRIKWQDTRGAVISEIFKDGFLTKLIIRVG